MAGNPTDKQLDAWDTMMETADWNGVNPMWNQMTPDQLSRFKAWKDGNVNLLSGASGTARSDREAMLEGLKKTFILPEEEELFQRIQPGYSPSESLAAREDARNEARRAMPPAPYGTRRGVAPSQGPFLPRGLEMPRTLMREGPPITRYADRYSPVEGTVELPATPDPTDALAKTAARKLRGGSASNNLSDVNNLADAAKNRLSSIEKPMIPR